MNEKQLKELADDMVEFLRALDKVVPDKVDPDLVDFLEKVASNEWLLTMMKNAMPKQTANMGMRARQTG